MKRILTVAAVMLAAASVVSATPLIGRGAGTLKPRQFIIQLDNSYSQTSLGYNWSTKEWKDTIADNKKVTSIGTTLQLGIGMPWLLKNWELMLMVPLAAKSQDTLNSLGLGDIELQTRCGIIAGKTAPVKLTAVGALGLPVADQNAKPKIGDGKLSGALGLIATTKAFGKAVGHLRAAYWLNGKTNDTTKAGNMLEYVAKVDYDFTKKFQLWASLVGTMQGRTEVNSTAKEKTEQDRHVAQVGLVVKPVPVLSVRPKVMLPLAGISRGGAIAPFSAGLDFWVTVPQPKKK